MTAERADAPPVAVELRDGVEAQVEHRECGGTRHKTQELAERLEAVKIKVQDAQAGERPEAAQRRERIARRVERLETSQQRRRDATQPCGRVSQAAAGEVEAHDTRRRGHENSNGAANGADKRRGRILL